MSFLKNAPRTMKFLNWSKAALAGLISTTSPGSAAAAAARTVLALSGVTALAVPSSWLPMAVMMATGYLNFSEEEISTELTEYYRIMLSYYKQVKTEEELQHWLERSRNLLV